MTWDLAIVALAVMAYALISRRTASSPLTAPIVFVSFGLAAGALFSLFDLAPGSAAIETLAEATLVLILFVDASRIRFGALRHEYAVPLRLLGVGLPLTIAAGAVLAAIVFPEFDLGAALVLAVALAPTDAALGQSVVSNPRLPSRISQGLNVEGGLNDGICVPLLLVALAIMLSETGDAQPVATLLQQMGGGILVGAAVGAAAALLLRFARRRRTISGTWEQIATLMTAVLTYAVAVPLGGSGFIAAFTGGAVFGVVFARARAEEPTADEPTADRRESTLLLDEFGAILAAVTFVVFGATILPDALGQVTWPMLIYVALSLAVIRLLSVALAMLGSHARLPTVAFLGWFGPRGLASIVFAVMILEDAVGLPATDTIVTTIYLGVAVSVFAHGLSAAPLAKRYASWFTTHPRAGEIMESRPAPKHRGRFLGPTKPRRPGGH